MGVEVVIALLYSYNYFHAASTVSFRTVWNFNLHCLSVVSLWYRLTRLQLAERQWQVEAASWETPIILAQTNWKRSIVLRCRMETRYCVLASFVS